MVGEEEFNQQSDREAGWEYAIGGENGHGQTVKA